MDCVDCTLPVFEYKQTIQFRPDLCECCHIATYGGDDQALVNKEFDEGLVAPV